MLVNQVIKVIGATTRLAINVSTKATTIISTELQQASVEARTQYNKSKPSITKLSSAMSKEVKSINKEIANW